MLQKLSFIMISLYSTVLYFWWMQLLLMIVLLLIPDSVVLILYWSDSSSLETHIGWVELLIWSYSLSTSLADFYPKSISEYYYRWVGLLTSLLLPVFESSLVSSSFSSTSIPAIIFSAYLALHSSLSNDAEVGGVLIFHFLPFPLSFLWFCRELSLLVFF